MVEIPYDKWRVLNAAPICSHLLLGVVKSKACDRFEMVCAGTAVGFHQQLCKAASGHIQGPCAFPRQFGVLTVLTKSHRRPK